MAITANVINAENSAVLDCLFFPEQNPMNAVYLQNQFSNIASSLSDIGRKFIDGSKELYQKAHDSEMIRRAKAMVRSAMGIQYVNQIMYYGSLQEVQSATPYMQNYLMASPVVRDHYNRQLCDGYSDTYVNIDPGTIKDTQYHYRRTMDGVITEVVDENGNEDWSVKNYFEDLLPGDRDLSIAEKSNILATWDVMEMFIKAKQDPTNPRGGEL
jgi:hypothetical protein